MATCLSQPAAMALKVDVISGPAVAMRDVMLQSVPKLVAAGKLMSHWLGKLHKA